MDRKRIAEIKAKNGTILTLTQSEDGIWQSGSYYGLIESKIERSLDNFLFDTSFPYDASASSGMGGFALYPNCVRQGKEMKNAEPVSLDREAGSAD